MRLVSERRLTAMLFTSFLAAGATALAAGFLILGQMIVIASEVPVAQRTRLEERRKSTSLGIETRRFGNTYGSGA